MRRNSIAIIGAAGAITGKLRATVENLALELSNAGFDLVTGGMDGVMRAVARGHSLASGSTSLVHIEPGWGHPAELNPHPAGIVRTDLGSMRNHLVVRSADLVIAVAGGTGTLSEIAIAWKEGKPIAALTGFGGWSESLADRTLDKRRVGETVAACASAEELVGWATKLRPEGVFAGRVNQGYYPHEVPCLHRIHEGEPSPVHKINIRYGMSMEKSAVVRRLEDLDRKVKDWNSENHASAVALVTFDDGWKEVTCLKDEFSRLPRLRPVIFVSEGHFERPMRPLPLQRFYQHCAERGLDPEDDAAHGGLTRSNLKPLTEKEQHEKLDELGVGRMPDPQWLLDPDDIAGLKSDGWIVASHGHCHENMANRPNLRDELSSVTEKVEGRGHLPWLAWPEGHWGEKASIDARKAGFRSLFALESSNPAEPTEGTVTRTIWEE